MYIYQSNRCRCHHPRHPRPISKEEHSNTSYNIYYRWVLNDSRPLPRASKANFGMGQQPFILGTIPDSFIHLSNIHQKLWYVGLTGGIGMGKSTVSGMLTSLGVTVVDSDQVCRFYRVPSFIPCNHLCQITIVYPFIN